MRTQRLIIVLSAILAVGCDNDDVARVIDPPAPTIDEQIIADCYVVRDALEAFAAENDSVYPDGWHRNDFIPFLPGGVELTNHYTGLATGPILYEPQWPGEIGVILYAEIGEPYYPEPLTGYRIIGRGRDGEVIRIDNLSRISQQTVDAYQAVLDNCDIMVATLDVFAAQNGGIYPGSLGGDALPSGDVLTDLLPGGTLFVNPFWGWQDSPVDGNASMSGAIGYQPQDVDGNGYWEGFIVDAVGASMITVIATRTRESPEDYYPRMSALSLRVAVENFAIQNGGEYPRDFDTDETPAGETLREILSCHGCTNPYTGTPAIRNGLASSRGDVGYLPIMEGDVVVGYVINALGLFNEELERFEVLTN